MCILDRLETTKLSVMLTFRQVGCHRKDFPCRACLEAIQVASNLEAVAIQEACCLEVYFAEAFLLGGLDLEAFLPATYWVAFLLSTY